jgi:K+-dependent Na+/Ca+ exchanger-like protein
MAAGGSAPELFTSFMGVFASGSDVGFGTIIGSAVFNVLFVIGMCALFSRELLTLTWWPLFRDCSYYLISLIVLAIFFGVDYGNGHGVNKIEWWESLILFCLYLGYVVIMKFNGKAEMFCKTKICKTDKTTNNGTVVVPNSSGIVTHSTSLTDAKAAAMKNQDVRASFLRPCKFRAGVLHLMLNQTKSTIIQRARTFVVADIVGDFKQTFSQIDTNGDGSLEREELAELLKELTGTPPSKEEVDDAFKDMGASQAGGEITLEMFKEWYIDSEARVSKQAHDAFDTIDADSSGEISQDELAGVLRDLVYSQHPDMTTTQKDEKVISEVATVLQTFGHRSTSTPTGGTGGTSGTEDGGTEAGSENQNAVFTITFEEFMKWYKDSILFQQQMQTNANEAAAKENGGEEGGEEPISLAFPETTGARVMYVVTFPLMFLLVMTVPDVRNPKRKKFFPISFIMSIVWIAVYSFLMVWWATIIGLVAGIPDTVMGLTFLAAGTSIPDLLTSVIVARQGLGDMAVSSSIGSNIFDILIGLPVPWMAYSFANNMKPMSVYSDSLFVSVITLVGMLMAVIATIAACKWQMSKALGGVMFCLYGAFVISDLARANWDMACNAVD